MASVWVELKRRNVVRVAIAYAVVSWLILQLADVLLPLFILPEWVGRFVVLLLLIGFPVALVFAWAFELTPEGLKKEKEIDRSESITQVTGRKLDFVIIGVLATALAMFALDKFVWTENVAPDVTAGSESRSIAVLPFVNMSADPNNEYFADGIAEEILNLLANIPELQVTSRSSAFSFKGQNLDVPTMAAKLNVAHVLEGSVRKSDTQLRITAQLIEVDTDTHLWSATYDRELKNVFAIQDEIAGAVANALQITLLGKEPKAVETNPESYALYLQAGHFLRRGTAEASKEAEDLIKKSLDIDPGYAPAWAKLGGIYFGQAAIYGLRPISEGRELARQAFQQALVLDSQYGPAFAGLGNIAMFYDWDFATASEHLQQALSLSPGDAGIVRSVARLERTLGHLDEAIDLYRRAIVLDPLRGHTSLGIALYFDQRYEEAVKLLRAAVSLNPNRETTHHRLTLVLLGQGDAQAALEAIEKEPDDGYRVAGLALVQHALGNADAADASLAELIEVWAESGAYQIAETYAFRGEIDDAFEWLEYAYEYRDSGLASLLLDPMFVNAHEDARWEPFLDKMGLPH